MQDSTGRQCVRGEGYWSYTQDASNSGDKLKATSFEDLPTVKKVLDWLSHIVESGSMVYQGIEIVNYDRSLTFLKNKHQESEYINVIQDCLKNQGTVAKRYLNLVQAIQFTR